MENEKFKKNIIKMLVVFSAAFFMLVGYLSYFEIRHGESIVESPYNKRNKDMENEILRGGIYDRSGAVIVDSKRQDDNTQKRVYMEGYEQPYAPIVGYYSSQYGMAGLERYGSKDLLDAGILNPFRLIADIVTKADRKGNNLVLTTDSGLQKAAYEGLGNYKGAVVAMDPKTGEVLAMVSKPTFNPATIDKDWEKLSKQDEQGPFINRAIQPGIYPPGSTFKIIVASWALENIKDIENKKYTDNGTLKIGNYVLSNYKNAAHGAINLNDALKVSSNVVFGQVGMELGADRLKSGAEAFGFNKNIDFELPVAVSQFPSIDEGRKDSLAQSSIGQYEVMTTPLQMALAASAIANGGTMMKPYIVKSVTDPYGRTVRNTKPEVMAQPIKKETAQKVTAMMVNVVKSGTGKNARISGIDVAGKTGTAEVGEDVPSHSWFVAFAPADDPKIAVSVIVENGENSSGRAMAIAKGIISKYLNGSAK